MRPVIARGSRGSVSGPVLARRLFRKLIALEREFSMSPRALESPSLANMFAASRHPGFDFFLCVRPARGSVMELPGAKSRRSRLCSGLWNTPGNSSELRFHPRKKMPPTRPIQSRALAVRIFVVYTDSTVHMTTAIDYATKSDLAGSFSVKGLLLI